MRTRQIVCMAFLTTGMACGAAAQVWLEDFETGTKGSYTAGDVTCTMGSWHMNDALIGNLANDRMFDTKSVRIQASGYISMNFDKATGAGTISVYFAKYGTDGNATGKIEYSTDGGINWTQAGDTVAVNSTTLTQATRELNIGGNVRFRFSKTGGTRVNVDNISITDFSGPAPLAAPVALEAEDVEQESFTANWTAVAEATGYLLDVYQVAITGAVAGAMAFDESFDGFTGGTSYSSPTSTDIAGTLDNYTEEAGWCGLRVYQAVGTVKLGTSAGLGWVMTPEIDLSSHGGEFAVSLKACAWSGDSTELKVFLVNGTETNSLGTVSGLNNDDTYTFLAKSLSGSGGTAASKLLFEGMQASNGRFFLEDLAVTQGGSAGAPQTNFVCEGAAIDGSSTNLTALTPGVYYYRVRAEDGERVSVDSNVIMVDTAAAPVPPVVEPVGPQTARLEGTLQFAVTVTPTEGDPVTATNAVAETTVTGAWSFEQGMFSYTPVFADLGEQRFVFTAQDKDGWSDPMTVSVTVRRAQVQAVVMEAASGTYTQKFDILESSGTANDWDNLAWPLPAWSVFAGSAAVTNYRTGTGTVASGGLYSWGTGADRSIGSLASSGNIYRYGVAFTNATGQAVTNLNVSFTAEQWRAANCATQSLTFAYCVTNRALPLTEGAWRRVKALCFESPVLTNETQTAGAVYAAAQLSAMVPRPVAAGEVVLLRWSDPDDVGNDHGFGVDDLAVAWATGAMPEAIPVTLGGVREDFDEMGEEAAEELPWMWRLEVRDDAPRVSGAYAAAGSRTTRANSVVDFTSAGGYNFAAASTLDRAMGGLSDAASAKSVTLSGKFANATGRSSRHWEISYNVEKYRNGTVSTAVQLLVSIDGETWQAAGAPTVFAADGNTDGYAVDARPGASVAEQRQVELAAPVAKGGVFYLAWQIAAAEGDETAGAQALGVDDIVVMPRVSKGSVVRVR